MIIEGNNAVEALDIHCIWFHAICLQSWETYGENMDTFKTTITEHLQQMKFLNSLTKS